MTDLTNVDEVLELLAGKLVHTDRGSYIKVDDLRELVEGVRQQKVEEEMKPQPKSFVQAKEMAKRDPNLIAAFGPPAASEGVKS